MDDFYKNKQIVDERRRANESKKKDLAKKRLERNVTKKIKTTMIGALASFEEGFGHLWGIDKPHEELTEDELYYDEIWEGVRRDVLNRGNLQIRAAKDEIEDYNNDYNYKVDFIRKDQE